LKAAKLISALIFASCVLAVTFGCATRAIRVPLDPYASPSLNHINISQVAVLPFVIPEYLEFREGGEKISIDLTNTFIAELQQARLFGLTDSKRIKDTLDNSFSSAKDWIYKGTQTDAAAVGRAVGADAVVFGVIKRYLSGTLVDSEVELELKLIFVSSNSTLWIVREDMLGKGGKQYLNEEPTTPSPEELSRLAIAGSVDTIKRIHQKGGPIKVSHVSTRKIWGYSALSAGVTSLAAGVYFFETANIAYVKYKSSDNDYDVAKYRSEVQNDDQMWMILGTVGLASLGTGIYLILTDHTSKVADEHSDHPKFCFMPTATPSGPGVVTMLRF